MDKLLLILQEIEEKVEVESGDGSPAVFKGLSGENDRYNRR